MSSREKPIDPSDVTLITAATQSGYGTDGVKKTASANNDIDVEYEPKINQGVEAVNKIGNLSSMANALRNAMVGRKEDFVTLIRNKKDERFENIRRTLIDDTAPKNQKMAEGLLNPNQAPQGNFGNYNDAGVPKKDSGGFELLDPLIIDPPVGMRKKP